MNFFATKNPFHPAGDQSFAVYEKNLSDVPAACGELYKKGVAALKQNHADSAIALFNQALEAEPGFVLCRGMLRRAQCARLQIQNSFLKNAVDELREIPGLADAEAHRNSAPLRAIHAAEQVLNRFPTSIRAHKILAQAALHADLPRTALLSLNYLNNQIPEDLDVCLGLTEALARTGRLRDSIALCGRLQKDFPGDKRVYEALGRLAQLAFDANVAEMRKAAMSAQAARLRRNANGPATFPLRPRPADSTLPHTNQK